MGCESGRQDSNLRPLVPQTSTDFPPRAEFDLEWFRREMVGMTTRARVLDFVGIAWTSLRIVGAQSLRGAGSSVTKVRASPHQMGRPIPFASARRERTLGGGCCGGILSAGTTQDKG